VINKICPLPEVVKLFSDRQCIMVGGFGVPGTPFLLIDALLESGRSALTLIKNEANEDHLGVSKLIEAGRVEKLIVSHLGLNATAIACMNRGEIRVDFYPQGILAEKIRCGGAGIYGFVTDIGVATILAKNKDLIQTKDGVTRILESALRADVALIHAARGDRYGNLVYTKSARNFNPAMATAARIVIAEIEEVVEIGEIPPDSIHTPGAFVDHVVVIDALTPEYGVLSRHVL
jgi:acetate CoA/acetoacetate CoA-transferase alpha subunit